MYSGPMAMSVTDVHKMSPEELWKLKESGELNRIFSKEGIPDSINTKLDPALRGRSSGGETISSPEVYAPPTPDRISPEDAITKAADIQAETARKDLALQEEMYDKQKETIQPQLDAGKKAIQELLNAKPQSIEEYAKSPGYEGGLEDGLKAIQRRQSARGSLLSGETAGMLSRFKQDYAADDYGQYLNRYQQSLGPLQSLSNIGQTAAGQGMQAASQYGATGAGALQQAGAGAGNAAIQMGNLNAANTINQGNASAQSTIGNANLVSGIGNAALQGYNLYKAYQNPYGNTYTNYQLQNAPSGTGSANSGTIGGQPNYSSYIM